ncbi:MAG: bifunctional phosphoglucose/phosphomannose isomerase [Candidatus Aenigmatarchaeota archaeon]
MLGFLEQFPEMVEEAAKLGRDVKVKGKFRNILVAGMGGSGIAGDLLQDYLKTVPVAVSKGYDVPDWVGRETLVFVVSHSGNTEETISMWRQAQKKGAKTIAIASGGKLGKAKTKVVIPGGMPPRCALPYLFIPILVVLNKLRIVKGLDKEVKDAVKTLKAFRNMHTMKLAKRLAERLYKHVPALYASDRYKAVVKRWRKQFNENSKTIAVSNYVPELNHNEVTGYANPKMRGVFSVVVLKDKMDSPKIKKRMELTVKAVKDSGSEVTVLSIPKGNQLSKILTSVYFGDWVSYFLAKEYGVEPKETKLQEELKKKMAEK